MDLKQLEVFTAVVKTGSFSRAAEQLYLTQPTVSTHIKKLEADLGLRLIDRNTKSLRITPAGERFYPYAQAMLNLRRRALADMRPQGGAQALRIGASTIPSAYVLPGVIARYTAEHPGVSFQIIRRDSLSVIGSVVRGETDLGLVGTCMQDQRCLFQPFAQDELVLAAPNQEKFRLLQQQGASLPRLLQEPLILRESSSGTRRETEHILLQLGLDWSALNIVATFNDPEAVKNSVVNGMGVSIISRWAVAQLQREGRVLLFPLGPGVGMRRLYIVTERDLPLTSLAADFTDFIRQEADAVLTRNEAPHNG